MLFRSRKEELLIEDLGKKLQDIAIPSISPRSFTPKGDLSMIGITQLVSFVKQARVAEIPERQIREKLSVAGWSDSQIDSAFTLIPSR